MISDVISYLPWWISLPLLVVAGVLALTVAFAAVGALVNLAALAWHGVTLLEVKLTEVFTNAAIYAVGVCIGLVEMLVNLLMWPLTILWEHTAMRAHNALALKAEALRQRQQLWTHWKREFRDQFPTFREFLDAFEGRNQQREEPQFKDQPRKDGREQGQRKQDPPRPPPPPPPPRPPPDPQRAAFIAACRVFGLPENGEFTLKDLTTRYRILISKAHPDRPGHSGHATSINVARDLIKQRKGWT